MVVLQRVDQTGIAMTSRNLCFCLDDIRTGFLCFGFHLLLSSYSHRSAFFCLGLRNIFISIGLIHL